ncbi:MAG TPA: trehalose-phosphatase [Candidatus Limnocylindrales bacterium]|nr:trehalose-phosphatase [Candidatus Limnocylindrales bacterium]
MRLFQNNLRQDQLLELFFIMLSSTHQRALLLDYDGTLAPFRIQRDQATPYPGVREALETLFEARHTRIVLITGRWIKDLIPLLGLKSPVEIWGSHGWERLMPDGTYEIAKLDERALQGLTKANAWIEAEGLRDRCEQKPASLALHWRGLELRVVKQMREKILKSWSLLSWETGLTLHEFDGGIELRVPGRSKGFAVETILSEMGEDTVVAYLGDDQTDEDAFKAVKGKGLGILVREKFRPTRADIWLKPPEELLEFFSNWEQACKKGK